MPSRSRRVFLKHELFGLGLTASESAIVVRGKNKEREQDQSGPLHLEECESRWGVDKVFYGQVRDSQYLG